LIADSLIHRSKRVENLQKGYFLSCPKLLQSDKVFEYSKQRFDAEEELGDNHVDGDDLKAMHLCNFYFNGPK